VIRTSSGAGVDLPGAPAEASASVTTPCVAGDGSAATEGWDAGTGPRADTMDAKETEQV
jgi:hypothetical protein